MATINHLVRHQIQADVDMVNHKAGSPLVDSHLKATVRCREVLVDTVMTKALQVGGVKLAALDTPGTLELAPITMLLLDISQRPRHEHTTRCF